MPRPRPRKRDPFPPMMSHAAFLREEHDLRVGLIDRHKPGPPLRPEHRAVGATCPCGWCEAP